MASTPIVLFRFDVPVQADDGTSFHACAVGAETPVGHWEGWIEFHRADGQGPVVCTDRETTQAKRSDVGYWATGLSRVYLEGALRRALDRECTVTTSSADRRKAAPRAQSAPIARSSPPFPRRRPTPTRRTPVLDPFAVHARGKGVLEQELRALSAEHLRAIIDAYELAGDGPAGRLTGEAECEALAARIIDAVRERAAGV